MTIIALSLALYLVSRFCILRTNRKTKPSQKATIKEKFLIDYVFYTSFVLLKPRVSNSRVLRSMWKNTTSGFFLIITLTWGGFLMNEFYMMNFLSSLTIPYYEKPIENIPGKSSYNNFRKGRLGCRSASLISRSMNNSSFERYLDTDERSMGAI